MRVGLSYTPANIALMSVVYLLSALPFFAGGATISTRDLAAERATSTPSTRPTCSGAGAGCLLLMPALNMLGAPGRHRRRRVARRRRGDLLRSAAARRRARGARSAGCRLAVVALAAAATGGFAVSTTKGHENHPVLFSKWNSFSRIGVYDQPYGAWSLSDRYTGPLPDTRLMDIDSAAGTQILKFGGDLEGRLVPAVRADRARLPPRTARGRTPAAKPRPFSALVIGTGGGRDLLSALVFGAASVDGVEINPIIVNDVMRGEFREYSGARLRPAERARHRRGRPQLRPPIARAATTSSRRRWSTRGRRPRRARTR